ncbi:MAG: hypothetical protein ACRCVJ_11675 [Clostridium sp.]|uniref:hypothetical protein n=1 Tax=Clostridium sp. TaxID=1506 RepID=UPI003F2DC445
MKRGCGCSFKNASCTPLNTKVDIDRQGDLVIEYEDFDVCFTDAYKINYCPICGKKLDDCN